MTEVVMVIGRRAGRPEVISELRRFKYRVCYSEEGAEALGLLRHQKPCAVIMDEGEHSGEGNELLEALRKATSVPIIVEGSGEEQSIVSALMSGADAYLPWPASPPTVVAYLRSLLRRENPENTGLHGGG